MMVEIFRTDVTDRTQARAILALLAERWPHYESNFDLEDQDRILRVAGEAIDPSALAEFVRCSGHVCDLLN